MASPADTEVLSEGSYEDWTVDELVENLGYGPPPEECFEDYVERLKRCKNIIAQRDAALDAADGAEPSLPESKANTLARRARILCEARQSESPQAFLTVELQRIAAQHPVRTDELQDTIAAQSWHEGWSAEYDQEE